MQIGNFLQDKKCQVYHAPFGVRLFEQDGDTPSQVDTLVEPDLTVVCDPDKLDDAGCKGAPLICPAYFPNKRKKAGEIPLLFYPNIEEGKTGSSVP